MILLLGGTSDTAPIASALAEAGYRVLVSTATDVPFDVGRHSNICRRAGLLDEDGMAALARERGIGAIVDATHPYASAVKATARRVAERLDIPYLTLVRPAAVREDGEARFAADHDEAARVACSLRRPVLITTGSRRLEPYVRESHRAGVPVFVRVLSRPESIEACRLAGIAEDAIVVGRGPFSVEENRAVIRRFGIGVLVTKDSGVAGGVKAKLEAARLEGCQVVVVRRPEQSSSSAFDNVEELIDALVKGST